MNLDGEAEGHCKFRNCLPEEQIENINSFMMIDPTIWTGLRWHMLEAETPYLCKSKALTSDMPALKAIELQEFKALAWQRRVQIQFIDDKPTHVLRC